MLRRLWNGLTVSRLLKCLGIAALCGCVSAVLGRTGEAALWSLAYVLAFPAIYAALICAILLFIKLAKHIR